MIRALITAMALTWALVLCAAPARAAIDGFELTRIEGVGDISLSDRFGTSFGAPEHHVNIADCQAYQGGEATFTVKVGGVVTGYVYGVAYAKPGAVCPKTHASFDGAVPEDCYVVEQDEPLPASEFDFNVSLDWLTGGDCGVGTKSTAKVYVVIEDPSVDTSEEYEEIDINIDLDPPDAPELVSLSAGDRRIEVTWKDEVNTDQVTYSVLWAFDEFDPADLTGVLKEQGIDGTTYAIEDESLVNGVTTHVAIVAVDDVDNESSLSNTETASPVETVDFWEHYQAQGGTDPGGHCFVATAAYGSPVAPQLGTLRLFRDQVLAPTAGGRAFVDLYYTWGPFAAAWIAERPTARAVVRALLWPLVWIASLCLAWSPAGVLLLLLAAGLSVHAWTGRRRRAGCDPALGGAR